jgi:hypothetical protein
MSFTCPRCGREEGHYLNCLAIPRALAPLMDLIPPPVWSVCSHEGCEDPVKGPSAVWCMEHGTREWANKRQYAKRTALQKKEPDDE